MNASAVAVGVCCNISALWIVSTSFCTKRCASISRCCGGVVKSLSNLSSMVHRSEWLAATSASCASSRPVRVQSPVARLGTSHARRFPIEACHRVSFDVSVTAPYFHEFADKLQRPLANPEFGFSRDDTASGALQRIVRMFNVLASWGVSSVRTHFQAPGLTARFASAVVWLDGARTQCDGAHAAAPGASRRQGR